MFRRFLLVAALALTPLAHGHDAGPDRKELAAVYRGLLDSVVELQKGIDEKHSDRRVEGAFVVALLHFLKLYEVTVKAECPECEIPVLLRPAEKRVDSAKRWFVELVPWLRGRFSAGWRHAWHFLRSEESADLSETFGKLSRLAAHGFTLGSGAVGEVFARYGYTYGIVWALATATFEILEHGPIPIHVGCAAFQTAFHLTGGLVLGTYRIGLNPCGDANLARRFWNAFPANLYEWKFWWRISRFFHQAAPLVVDEHEARRQMDRLLVEYTVSVESFVSQRVYSDEARAYLSNAATGWRPPTLVEDLELVLSDAPTPQRQWVAKQHSEGLAVLLSALREALKSHSATLGVIDYFRLKRVTGALGRLIDEYASSLAAAALAVTIEKREEKLAALKWGLGEILEIFRRPELLAIFGDELPGREVYGKLKREIEGVRRLQRELRKADAPLRMIPPCSALLSGRAA